MCSLFCSRPAFLDDTSFEHLILATPLRSSCEIFFPIVKGTNSLANTSFQEILKVTATCCCVNSIVNPLSYYTHITNSGSQTPQSTNSTNAQVIQSLHRDLQLFESPKAYSPNQQQSSMLLSTNWCNVYLIQTHKRHHTVEKSIIPNPVRQ